MITYIEYGDIFALDNITNYAHGCNCAGAMGKGIAVQFKEKFPEMYLEYKQLCKNRQFTLGDVYTYKNKNITVFNLGTQATWKTKASISAIGISISKMLTYATENNISKIALPKIGAGLGGLNWKDVKQVIEENAKVFPNVELYIIENYLKEVF